jgi:DNA-binding LytR/AlgR family response regulator
MRVLIVDDEGAARRRLVRLLEDLDVEVAGEAADGLAALDVAERTRPDVILLDIEMPEVSGLDVARRLSDPRPLIIFQTAFDQYALDAFEREALDFLLKPVTRDRLAHALARADRRLSERAGVTRVTAEMAARLEASLGRGVPRRPPRRLLVRHQAGHRLLPLTEIDRFVAAEGVVHAVAGRAQHMVDDPLDELERRLATAFVRTSRAELVAIDRVDRIVGNGDGSATLVLKDRTECRVSRRRAADVRQALER